MAVLIIIVGFIFDCSKDVIGPIVNNFDSVSLTVLQIQASISAISISILALVSGFISDEYCGVSFTNYYLNIKPIIFKQKFLICGSLALDGISILFHLYSLYNVVIAVIWVNCLLIIYSVIELYGIFNGRNRICEEIDCYIEYILLGKNNTQKTERYVVFAGFLNAWAEKNLNSVDYEYYLKRYKRTISLILQEDKENALRVINAEAANLIKRQIALLDKSKLYRAYEILDETYLSIWMYILENQCTGINADFTLYEDCVEEVIDLINSMNTADLSSNISWRKTTDNIIRVKIYCNKDINLIMKMPDERFLQTINWFITTLGYSLAERRRKGDIISSNRWKFNSIRYYFNANIPDEILSEYKQNQCKLEFSYYYSILKNGMMDIASTVFKNKGYSNKYSYEKILFILLVLVYTYYIGERESLKCVLKEEKENAQKLLIEWKKDDFLFSTIFDIAWDISPKFLVNLNKDMDSILNHYERMPLDGDIKSCIVNVVSSDFYLFFISSLIGVSRREELFDKVFTNQDVINYYFQYFGNNTENSRGRLLQLLPLFSDTENSKQFLEEGFELVSTLLLKKYKKLKIEENKINYFNFLSTRNNISINEKVLNILKSSISKWTCESKKDVSEIKRILLRYRISVELVDAELINHLKQHLETNLMLIIISDLYKAGRITKLHIPVKQRSRSKRTACCSV